ncbi:MAG: hypothetical protein R2752_12740 [Vicinamibacterales bacterium]
MHRRTTLRSTTHRRTLCRGVRGALGLALVLATAACGAKSPSAPSGPSTPRLELTGEWVRISSASSPDLDGLVIRISDDGTQAVIVSAPSNSQHFAAGEVKWRNLRRTSDTSFNFEDLLKAGGGVTSAYVPEYLDGGPTGNELTVGTRDQVPQRWQRK